MKSIIYFFQFIFISFLFAIFWVLGLKISINFASLLFKGIGPLFRSKQLIKENIKKAFPDINRNNLDKIVTNMWGNYGQILAEYIFLKE